MNRDMIVSGVVNNLVGTAFTVVTVVLVFLGRRLWLKYGKQQPKRRFVRTRYTCPHCGETATIDPVHEELS